MTTLTRSMQLGTSETPIAAGQPAQRAITRADGTLWAVFPDAAGGSLQCLHSTDGGATWQPAQQSEVVHPVYNASMTIDEEGHADLVYAGEGPEYLFYRKGAPIEGGWQWSIRVRIFDVPLLASVNAVALAEKDEWKIHVVWSRGGEFASVYYNSFKIDPEREIWLGTRERLAGPFDTPGHPAASLDMNVETKQLHAAMWAGSQGVALADAIYLNGRWKWNVARSIPGSAPAHEGSVSAVWFGDSLAVAFGSGDDLVLHTTGGLEARAAGPAGRVAAGVDAGATLHVLYQGLEPGPLYHRVLEGSKWGEAEEVHAGPVTSFSCEAHGDESVGAIFCTGADPPYSIEFLSVK